MRGRRKKYTTAKALEKAVTAYFESISRMEPVLAPEDTGELDKYGHKICRMVEVVADNGKPIMERVFYVPPDRYGLTDFLRISIDTWNRYGEDKELCDVVTWAEEQIRGWESRELRRRENKHTAGLIHAIESGSKSKSMTDSGGDSTLESMTDAQLLAMAEGRA